MRKLTDFRRNIVYRRITRKPRDAAFHLSSYAGTQCITGSSGSRTMQPFIHRLTPEHVFFAGSSGSRTMQPVIYCLTPEHSVLPDRCEVERVCLSFIFFRRNAELNFQRIRNSKEKEHPPSDECPCSFQDHCFTGTIVEAFTHPKL